jgi:hypothetical protein
MQCYRSGGDSCENEAIIRFTATGNTYCDKHLAEFCLRNTVPIDAFPTTPGMANRIRIGSQTRLVVCLPFDQIVIGI